MLAAWMIAMAVLQVGQPQPADPRSQGQVPLGGWPEPGPVVKAMMAQAEKLAPLVKSERARRFLEVARELPEPGAMVVYRDAAGAIVARSGRTMTQYSAAEARDRNDGG